MKRLLCILLTAIVLLGCAKDDYKSRIIPDVAAHTMLLYMPGRDLAAKGFYDANIKGVCQAVSASVPGNGRILVCHQPQSNDKAVLMEIYYDPNSRKAVTQVLKSYDTFEAGSRACVEGMLADAAKAAPAESYGLIIGCHGKAWVPTSKSITSYSVKRPGHDLGTPLPGAKQTRAFGDSGHDLEITDLAAAITAQPDFHPDYLIFDACFMANIETLYDLRGAVARVIASPCEIMGAGFPYARTIPYMFADRGATQNLQRVCEEFWKFYMYDWDTLPNNAQSGCISLCITSELNALASVMQQINATANGNNPDASSLQIYEGISSHLFFDLGDYVNAICKDPALLATFNARFDEAFPAACRLYTPSFYSEFNDNMNPITSYSGVSLSEPSERLNTENRQTAWYVATH